MISVVSHNRRLADMDKDNALSEEEFCVAMKLVLLRRKGYRLPSSLPDALRSAEGEVVHFLMEMSKKHLPNIFLLL